MDVENIPAGVDFVDYLTAQVAACDVFLAVIGPNCHTSRKSADGSIHVYADPDLKDAPLRQYSRSSSENE
jgi:hypothetical protein